VWQAESPEFKYQAQQKNDIQIFMETGVVHITVLQSKPTQNMVEQLGFTTHYSKKEDKPWPS
jgi:hypothetical protein